MRNKKAIWPGIIQPSVNAGSRRIGVKTARPVIDQGLQTTVRGPDAAREAISSRPRSHFANDEKIIYSGPEFFLRKMLGTRYGSVGTRFL